MLVKFFAFFFSFEVDEAGKNVFMENVLLFESRRKKNERERESEKRLIVCFEIN